MTAAELFEKETLELGRRLVKYRTDPLGFVKMAYPWPIAGHAGPDVNQTEFLESLGEEVRRRGFNRLDPRPVMPVKMAMASGHGSGKSAMGAWLVNWIMSTRPWSQGTVTAGTSQQLEDRTWAAIKTWTARCITASWWEVQADVIYARPEIVGVGHAKEDWKVIAQTCKDENRQSFAGQHAAASTSWYLFDEASAVPDGIWVVAEGGLTDGEPMWFCWGQPERNTGGFFAACFGDQKHRWNVRSVDSRTSAFTNKGYIEEYIADHGIDSDLVRVRILGQPPKASELQFIDWERIEAAQGRAVMTFADEPLIAGVDCSGGGSAWNVCRFRRGYDARTIPPIRISGAKTRNDPHVLTVALAEVLRDTRPEKRVAAMFIDMAFGAHIAERLRSMGFQQVHTVNFGGDSPDPRCLNWRAAMYSSGKEWLLLGGLPAGDKDLAADLAGPGATLNTSRKIVIESKASMAKRKVKSPDDGDAFMLTFAQPVGHMAPEMRLPGGQPLAAVADRRYSQWG